VPDVTDHDRLFKELIRTFFMDFMWLFFPNIAADIDPDSVVFLDKEIFTDISSGEKHIADLVARVKVKGSDTFIIINVEHQSKSEPEFPARLFKYFARLYEKYLLPIFPVVIYSHSQPRREEPSRFDMEVFGKAVLKFEYTSIQLNRMSWRQFIDQPSPVATALMTRMDIAKKDRPKVKAECLRLLATLRLDPAKSRLIGVFIETYLALNREEMKIYEQEFEAMVPGVKEATMEMMTSWHKQGREEGRAEGRREGKEDLLARQLERRFSTLPDSITEQLDRLTPEKLDELGLEVFNFTSLTDLETWLSYARDSDDAKVGNE
jgi:predicted transposase/invertase (TIGR01784 family)